MKRHARQRPDRARSRHRHAPTRLATGLALALLCAACGGASAAGGTELLPELRSALAAPVDSREQRKEHSRLVQRIVESDVLQGKTRHEVKDAIGRGDPCSRHPRCAQHDFSSDDWFYSVGRVGRGGEAGPLPILIVGFDQYGKVHRTWNLRVH